MQRSAYPEAYADHEQEGRLLASTLSGHSPEGLGCRLDDARTGDPAALTALKTELGVTSAVAADAHRDRRLRACRLERRRHVPWRRPRMHGATSVRVGSREWTPHRNVLRLGLARRQRRRGQPVTSPSR